MSMNQKKDGRPLGSQPWTSQGRIGHIRCLSVLISAYLWILSPLYLEAQKVEWGLSANGFFDNSEGDDNYASTQTLAGIRLTPEVGLSLQDGKHRIMLGATGISEPGKQGKVTGAKVLAYYQYQSDKKDWKFTFGSFPRQEMAERTESYLISDSIQYFRSDMQGFDLVYHRNGFLMEVFLDWTGVRHHAEREQFMAGYNLRKDFSVLRAGVKGHYYHYALSEIEREDEHIHDFAIIRPYIGLELRRAGVLNDLELKAGPMLTLDRERGSSSTGWKVPVGLLLEARASIWRIDIEEAFYTGRRLQTFGIAHCGKYYWGEPYLASKTWSRTDLRVRIIESDHVCLSAGVIVNATAKGLNHHQVLTLSMSLGSRQKDRLSL